MQKIYTRASLPRLGWTNLPVYRIIERENFSAKGPSGREKYALRNWQSDHFERHLRRHFLTPSSQSGVGGAMLIGRELLQEWQEKWAARAQAARSLFKSAGGWLLGQREFHSIERLNRRSSSQVRHLEKDLQGMLQFELAYLSIWGEGHQMRAFSK